MKNYAELIPVLKEIVMLAKKKDITIGEVLQKLDHYGFSLIALLLVLPFMQPFYLISFNIIICLAEPT